MLKRSFFLGFLSLALPLLMFSQVSHGGEPASRVEEGLTGDFPTLELAAPEITPERGGMTGKPGMPLQAGVAVDANVDMMALAKREKLANGIEVYRVGIHIPGAEALGVYFDEFHIPPGGRLFAYDASGEYLIGAFTDQNNAGSSVMALSLIPGDKVILEYDRPLGGSLPRLHINELAYHFLPFGESSRDANGNADFCEVNINCSPEGDEWQDEKRGVARIYVKEGGSFFWCTGSLVNNVRRDRTPYFLTADHCGQQSSSQDYQSWVFYFDYESEDCDDPFTSPEIKSVTGATLLSSYDSDGSDFKLLLIGEEIPDDYNPYFNGWNRSGIPSDNGVSIHHPSGDIKKVSTYNTELTSVSWSGTPGTHWQVYWTETLNGYGVTEGGSSGAPIFDEDGLIIGTLTGGLAACEAGGSGPGTGPDKPDYYGKFSYSWSANGSTSSERLAEWLDPDNTGTEELRGINNFLQADFEASEMILLTDGEVVFTDLSSGIPDFYRWEFEGGVPGTYDGPGPVNVVYPHAGTYDVSLIVSDDENTDTLHREDYIRVVGQVYPNPSNTVINVFVGNEPPEFIQVEMIDLSGRLLYKSKIKGNTSSILSFDVSFLPAGMYVVRLVMNDRFHTYKFIVPPSF